MSATTCQQLVVETTAALCIQLTARDRRGSNEAALGHALGDLLLPDLAGFTSTVEDTAVVDADTLVPSVVSHLGDGTWATSASVGDEDVKAAEVRSSLVDDLLALV